MTTKNNEWKSAQPSNQTGKTVDTPEHWKSLDIKHKHIINNYKQDSKSNSFIFIVKVDDANATSIIKVIESDGEFSLSSIKYKEHENYLTIVQNNYIKTENWIKSVYNNDITNIDIDSYERRLNKHYINFNNYDIIAKCELNERLDIYIYNGTPELRNSYSTYGDLIVYDNGILSTQEYTSYNPNIKKEIDFTHNINNEEFNKLTQTISGIMHIIQEQLTSHIYYLNSISQESITNDIYNILYINIFPLYGKSEIIGHYIELLYYIDYFYWYKYNNSIDILDCELKKDYYTYGNNNDILNFKQKYINKLPNAPFCMHIFDFLYFLAFIQNKVSENKLSNKHIIGLCSYYEKTWSKNMQKIKIESIANDINKNFEKPNINSIVINNNNNDNIHFEHLTELDVLTNRVRGNNIQLNSIVEINYLNNGIWYPGKVTKINNKKYDIQLDAQLVRYTPSVSNYYFGPFSNGTVKNNEDLNLNLILNKQIKIDKDSIIFWLGSYKNQKNASKFKVTDYTIYHMPNYDEAIYEDIVTIINSRYNAYSIVSPDILNTKCIDEYCNTKFSCFNLKINRNLTSALFKDYDIESNKTKPITVIGVIENSKKSEYININVLKSIMYNKDVYNANSYQSKKFDKNTPVQVFVNNAKNINKLKDTIDNNLIIDKFANDIYNLNNLVNEFTPYHIELFNTKLKEIDDANKKTPIGILEMVDSISKFGRVNTFCKK